MKRIPQTLIILCLLLIVTSPVLAGKEAQINRANEVVLENILLAGGYGESHVSISDESILVSIEVSDANTYDEELIAWWGSIFGNAALLKGYGEAYSTITIENRVNGEAELYLGANLATVDDYIAVRIDDGTFWDEVLITSKKPTVKDIENYAGLPESALKRDQFIPKKERKVGWLILLIILILIGGGISYLCIKHPHQVKKVHKNVKMKTKKHVAQAKTLYATTGKKALQGAAAEGKRTYAEVKTEAKKLHKNLQKELQKRRKKHQK